MSTRRDRPRRSALSLVLGWGAAVLASAPALTLGPWLLLGVLWGWSGEDGTGTSGPTRWGELLFCAVLLALTVILPLVVGIGVCRGADAAVRRRDRSTGDAAVGPGS